MNKTIAEARVYASALAVLLADENRAEVAVAPPFTALDALSSLLERGTGGKEIHLAAQNVFYEEEGAFTGEISALMLKEIGCRYVIVGHSERRGLFSESDEVVARKADSAVKSGLCPILCVGETLGERERGATESVVGRQLQRVMERLSSPRRFVVVYEPVWAIGTGKNATPDQIGPVHAFLHERLGAWAGSDVRILYGGSVTVENIEMIVSIPGVDGALVGGAALDAKAFASIVKKGAKCISS